MTLTKSSSGDFYELALFLEILDRRAATVTHTGTDTADQLEGYGAKVELALALGKKISDGYDQK